MRVEQSVVVGGVQRYTRRQWPIRILCLGDIVGRPGRQVVHQKLPALVKERKVDLVVANAENIAGGSGITAEPVPQDPLVRRGRRHAGRPRLQEGRHRPDAPDQRADRAAGEPVGRRRRGGRSPSSPPTAACRSAVFCAARADLHEPAAGRRPVRRGRPGAAAAARGT